MQCRRWTITLLNAASLKQPTCIAHTETGANACLDVFRIKGTCVQRHVRHYNLSSLHRVRTAFVQL